MYQRYSSKAWLKQGAPALLEAHTESLLGTRSNGFHEQKETKILQSALYYNSGWHPWLMADFLWLEEASCWSMAKQSRKNNLRFWCPEKSCPLSKSNDHERWLESSSFTSCLLLFGCLCSLSSSYFVWTVEASGNFLVFFLFQSFTNFPSYYFLIALV